MENNFEVLNRERCFFWSDCEIVLPLLEGGGYLRHNAYQSKYQTVDSQIYWFQARWQKSVKRSSLRISVFISLLGMFHDIIKDLISVFFSSANAFVLDSISRFSFFSLTIAQWHVNWHSYLDKATINQTCRPSFLWIQKLSAIILLQ